ncbi:MAG: hypothetical protein RAP03_09430 [Candidatus Electryonea clarkiae]|nr:hypothetical protein [Candidatus Electryonea clarkiae]
MTYHSGADIIPVLSIDYNAVDAGINVPKVAQGPRMTLWDCP